MEEKAIQIKLLPSVNDEVFTFVPPVDAKQVDEPLSIVFFNEVYYFSLLAIAFNFC